MRTSENIANFYLYFGYSFSVHLIELHCNIPSF